MTQNRRIILNIIATYGRSLYALAIGLFCGRWTLMALGEVDYGLMGVVGGLTAFVGFFFGILSGAVGRFYAFAIGQAQSSGDSDLGLEECRRWFSLAVTIHTVVPAVLLLIGYPLGAWTVRNYLTIPPDRVLACLWVWRFTCASFFVSMLSTPFNAMYGAKQYIAELTVYSFATATCNVFFLYYMVTHPGLWLVRFSLWTCILSIAPQIIIAVHGCFLFPECRFRLQYCWSWRRYKQMLSYTGWNTFGSLGYLLKGQGISILVNKYFGPSVNAAMNVANTVSSHTQSLAAAMQGAFAPAITTAIGAGDVDTARRMAFRFCKFGMGLSLMFMLPLALELPYIMRLWLKEPPPYATGLCWLLLLVAFIDKNTLGHGVAVMAKGEIMWYQIVLGTFNLLALPFAWIFCALGCNVYFVNVGVLIAWCMLVYGRLFFARRLLGMSIRYWMRKIMFPIVVTIVVSVCLGLIPRVSMPTSMMRLTATFGLVEVTYLSLAWMLVLDKDERRFVLSRLQRAVGHG